MSFLSGILVEAIWGHDMMGLFSAQSPIQIDGTDVMEMMRTTTTARMREGTGEIDDDDNDKKEG